MIGQIYFANIKRAITGTIVGSNVALDVNVVASGGSQTVKETRYHDTASVTINGSGGAFVEVATAADIANTISKIQISIAFGQPIIIRTGANAGAAAAGADILILNKGERAELPVSLVAGDKIWVRSASATAISSGTMTLNLIG